MESLRLIILSGENSSNSSKYIRIMGHLVQEHLEPFQGLFWITSHFINAGHLVKYFWYCDYCLEFIESLKVTFKSYL